MEPLLHVETETQRIHSLEIEVFAAYDTFDNVMGMMHWTNFLLSCLIDTIKGTTNLRYGGAGNQKVEEA
jgi:hypothetical protein